MKGTSNQDILTPPKAGILVICVVPLASRLAAPSAIVLAVLTRLPSWRWRSTATIRKISKRRKIEFWKSQRCFPTAEKPPRSYSAQRTTILDVAKWCVRIVVAFVRKNIALTSNVGNVRLILGTSAAGMINDLNLLRSSQLREMH